MFEKKSEVANTALQRVQAKLTGTDFSTRKEVEIKPVHQTRRTTLDQIFMDNTPRESLPSLSLPRAHLHPSQARQSGEEVSVTEQVNLLILEATSLDNLAEAYITGWAPFW